MEFSSDTALIVIDVQEAFNLPRYKELNGESSTPECIPNIVKLLYAFRAASLPVIHIHHHSTSPSSLWHPANCSEGVVPTPETANIPGEIVFIKSVNSAFIGTGLEAHLRREKITKLVVVGLSTIHCVSTTVRMAGNLGWDVYLVRDATATFSRKAAPGGAEGVVKFDAKMMHEVALAELNEEFVTVVTTRDSLECVTKS